MENLMREQPSMYQGQPRIAALVGLGNKNSPFENEGASDGRTALYAALRRHLRRQGVELVTKDVCDERGQSWDFEVHVNVQKSVRASSVPCYVLLLETPYVRALNADEDLLGQYQKIFSWRRDMLGHQDWHQISGYPVPICSHAEDGWAHRSRLVCMIASNKSIRNVTRINLYQERIKVIRWWERHFPDQFDLFGPGWGMPPTEKTLWGSIQRRWYRLLSSTANRSRFFSSWRGIIPSKNEILRTYRFAYCYENVGDMPGYVTEKIFDAMGAGCVPIYLGAPDVGELIPDECFIDRRAFDTEADVWRYLNAMTESDYKARQKAMQSFLKSEEAKRFDSENFGREVAQIIFKDLAT